MTMIITLTALNPNLDIKWAPDKKRRQTTFKEPLYDIFNNKQNKQFHVGGQLVDKTVKS